MENIHNIYFQKNVYFQYVKAYILLILCTCHLKLLKHKKINVCHFKNLNEIFLIIYILLILFL